MGVLLTGEGAASGHGATLFEDRAAFEAAFAADADAGGDEPAAGATAAKVGGGKVLAGEGEEGDGLPAAAAGV